MQLILLPGMDGTGILFRPLIEKLNTYLPSDSSVQVIAYPCDQELSYCQLIDFVLSKLPAQEEVILVAESFSGPIGYALATKRPEQIQAIIFAATFLTPPKVPLWKLPPRFVSLLMKIPLPVFLLKQILFDEDTANETVALFRETTGKVESRIIAARMREITGLRIERQSLDVPCAYIQPDNDRLITSSHTEEFRIVAPHIKLLDIPGPHFILQARPEESAQVIGEFLSSIH